MSSADRTVLTVDCGKDGNFSEYKVTGWGNPEQRFTWTSGYDSKLWLPRPKLPGAYALKMAVRPFLFGGKLTEQKLHVLVNGQNVENFQIRANTSLECSLPWELISDAESILVHFRHPDAAVVSEPNSADGERVIAIAFEQISLCQVEESADHGSIGPEVLEGHIDFYGHHPAAGGWIFAGWVSAALPKAGQPTDVTAQFAEGQAVGARRTMFHFRDDVAGRGVGMILFIPGPHGQLRDLVSVELRFANFVHIVYPTPAAKDLPIRDLVGSLKSTIADVTLDPGWKARLLSTSRTAAAKTIEAADQRGTPIVASKVFGSVDTLRGPYLDGWAIARPGTSDCLVEATDLKTGALLGRVRATRSRGDLRGLGYGRINFGFTIPLAIKDDIAADIRVAANGIELAGSPIRTDLMRFYGTLRIEDGCVRGTVADAFSRIQPSLITLQDQAGRVLGEALPVPALFGINAPAHFTFPLTPQCYGQSEYMVRALVGDREIARAQCDLRLEGYLDILSADRCVGWLLSPDAPSTHFQIEIMRDGEVVGHGRCDMPRPDLQQLYPLSSDAGFNIRISPPHAELGPAQISIRLEDSEVELFGGPFTVGRQAGIIEAAQAAARIANIDGRGLSEVSRALIRAALSKFCAEQRGGEEDYVRINSVALAAKAATPRRINIVIPVYRGVEVTRDCIDSVLKHRNADTDGVILVNDCSPEPAMAGLLQSYLREPNVFLLTNQQNQGFVRSVNRALEFCRDADIVLLNSDTTVFEGCFDELCKVAHSTGDIATVTAISNNATIFTYPHPRMPSRELADITWTDLASAALHENAGVAVNVPTGHGFCMLLKRDILDQLGPFNEVFGRGYGEENEFCCRAADLGYRHVAAAGVFVEHREGVSFGSEKASLLNANLAQLSRMYPEYPAIVEDYERRDDLRQGRWSLDAHRLARACKAGASFALVVENSLGGGTATAVANIEEAVGYGGARKLSLTATEDKQLILEAEDPVVRAVFQPGDVAALFAVLERVNIPLVIVHQLLGFPRDLIERLGRYVEGKRSVYYLHDFYSLCPRVTMVDAVGEFCNGAAAAVCARCVTLAGSHGSSRLESLTPEAHRALFADFMARVRHVVAPSEDTAERVKAIFAGVPILAIPHPQAPTLLQRRTAPGSFDNVILFGAIGPHKGSAKLLEIARRAHLSCPELTFHVLGYTDIDEELLEVGNVLITGAYQPDDLPGLVAAASGRLALFLHGWPETFSFTLSEAVQHGLIPLVPDIGAPAARVRAADYGALFPFPIDAAAVLDLIRKISAGEVGVGNGDPTAFGTEASATLRELFAGSDKSGPSNPILPSDGVSARQGFLGRGQREKRSGGGRATAARGR